MAELTRSMRTARGTYLPAHYARKRQAPRRLLQCRSFWISKDNARVGEARCGHRPVGRDAARTSAGLTEVHRDAFELQVVLASVAALSIHSVLIADHLCTRQTTPVIQSGCRRRKTTWPIRRTDVLCGHVKFAAMR